MVYGDELAAALAARLTEVFGEQVTVDRVDSVSMGASRELFAFDAARPDGPPLELILRRDPPAATRAGIMAAEAAALRAAAAEGAPVPEVYDVGDGTEGIGTPYVIMQRLPGETIPWKLLREDRYADARAGLARSLGENIAKVHRIARQDIPGLEEIDQYEHWLETYRQTGPPSPAFEIGFRWLAEHRPEVRRTTVVHGDVRMGNIIVDESGLTGILDWELIHYGDPLQDLGWVTTKPWRFGSAMPAAGTGTRDDLLDGYASVAGERPGMDELIWWEVLSTIRWGVMCRTQADRHLRGSEESLELAMIGRRFAENEHDTLLALGLIEPHPTADPLAADDVAEQVPHLGDMFHYPTGDQLLEAITRGLGSTYADRLHRGAINVVRRELLAGDRLSQDYLDALVSVGHDSEESLALAIRDGSVALDDPAVLRAIQVGIDAQLAIWNPKYTAQPGGPDGAYAVSI